MGYLIWPGESCEVESLGRKAGALAALRWSGLPIPAWFVVSPEAFHASLREAERQALERAGEASPLLALIGQVALCKEALRELEAALAKLCPAGERVAVRSSACDEDGARHSFAGQFDSFLCVSPSEVADRVAAVWRSGFSERVRAYRHEHALNLAHRPPAVLVQRMVDAAVSGVAFGADPVSGRRGVAVVAAVYGLGSALVSGECDADTYHVDRDGRIIHRAIADKRMAHRAAPQSLDGVRAMPVGDEDAKRPALTDGQVRAVAELVRQTGRVFGRAQDIEWAIEDGRLYLLQSRPITSLAATADPDGVLNVWDNSNIAESYAGVTTPLTFSFARRAYEEVYRQFCRLMGVHATVIAAHDDIFRHMLGLIRGRVYYNLLNWYRLLAMLPGYTFNRRFMEQMMGVRESLPEAALPDAAPVGWRDRVTDGLHLLGTVGGLVLNHFRLPARIRDFSRRLEAALAPVRPGLEDRRADELVAYYRNLERQLLTRWDAPLINDFFAMIFHGVLRRLAEAWCGGRERGLHNDLLCGEGGMISAEPAQRMHEMAEVAADDPAFVARLCEGSLDAIVLAMQALPQFATRFREYLERFGDRCLEELKLESPTLHEDPLPLLRSAGGLARRLLSAEPGPPSNIDIELRRRAERRMREALAGRPFRRLVFGWVLRHARSRVRDRENLRFERTRVFGLVRRIFLELGRRLSALDRLDAPRDVFYLEVDEVIGFIDGTATCTDLKGLVALRQTEFAAYREGEPAANRFETRGIVHVGNAFRGQGRGVEVPSNGRCSGIGCSPGIVRGPVRVITDPRNAALRSREILVAERTDPGWILLFPAAAGLLVERGSLLSHSAIVAREMGIPAVVSVEGITRWLKDGDWVELDGSSGVISRVEPPAEVAGVAE